jgi:hypothetical protein
MSAPEKQIKEITIRELPCDPLGDHMARCTDPLCQVCHPPDGELLDQLEEAL